MANKGRHLKGYGYSFITGWLGNYRRNAKVRGLSFELTRKEFENIIRGDCVYCGAEPALRKHRAEEAYVNGVDRIDSSKGYSVDNCIPCCSLCNRMKGDMPYDEWIEHIRRVAEYV